jgi:hypothetical protein
MRGLILAIAASGLLLPSAARPEAENRFWILWERMEQTGTGCPNSPQCLVLRNYTSRLFENADLDTMYRLFGMMDGSALAKGRLAEHPDAPRICQHNDAEVVLGFDPERLPKVEKIEVLRGLEGISFDLRKLKPPPGHSSDFGRKLHKLFEQKLRQAGIPVLSEDELRRTPGQPVLSVFFSHNDFNGHCKYEYSVFASLSQTVLLSRDLRIKVSAGVWSFSTGSNAEDHRGTEADAILSVADRFIEDFRLVNP